MKYTRINLKLDKSMGEIPRTFNLRIKSAAWNPIWRYMECLMLFCSATRVRRAHAFETLIVFIERVVYK